MEIAVSVDGELKHSVSLDEKSDEWMGGYVRGYIDREMSGSILSFLRDKARDSVTIEIFLEK